MLTGQQRDKWIEGQYRKYHKKQWIALASILIGGIGLFAIAFLLPPDIPFRAITVQIFSFSAVFFVGLGVGLSDSAAKFLPPVEDRALYQLKSALVNLKAYSSNGDEESKKKAIENLGKVADALDNWTWGNLRFLREGVGNSISEFRKNFRGRLIPAIRNADRRTVQSFFMWFTGTENALEMGQLDQTHIMAWNNWLSQFPYHLPSPSVTKKLRSKKLQLGVVVLTSASPIITGIIAFDILHTSIDTAVIAATGVFTGLALVGLGLLTLGRQRPS